VVATGCGSSSSSDSGSTSAAAGGGSTTASSGGGSGSSDCVRTAKAAVDAARAPVTLRVSSEPVDFGAVKNRNVWFISTSQSIPLMADISKGFVAGAQAAGVSPHVFDGKGDVNTQNQGLATAIAQGAGGIVLQGINPQDVSASLARAAQARIPVIDSFNGGSHEPLATGLQAHVTADFPHDGKVMGDYILQATNCDAHVAAFGGKVYRVNTDLTDGAQQELRALSPSSSFSFENVDAARLATDLGPQTQTVLNRTPNLNYLIAAFDGAATYMVPAVQSSGKSVPLIGHDGVASNLKSIRDGQVQTADFAFPPAQAIGWAETDQLGRVMTGMRPAEEDSTVPSRLIDRTNVGTSDDALFPGYEGYQQKYKQLWGK